ncbi:MAG: phosphoribosyl-ATP pyrophosphohydrolase [Alphaproteobacteria bacterium]|jgi:phosphoribosyl-ATP pyrophosphohydrolase
MTDTKSDIEVLQRLFAVIEARRGEDGATSYTADLLAKGPVGVAKKLGEEAVETVLAAATGDKDQTIYESADLLYHLLVLWAAAGISPDDVWAELARREGTSGIAEKASRKK